MNAVKRGRPRKEPVVMTESKGWLAIDKAAAYQALSQSQRLIFQA